MYSTKVAVLMKRLDGAQMSAPDREHAKNLLVQAFAFADKLANVERGIQHLFSARKRVATRQIAKAT